jgi:peptidoglycan-N-acetylglucosamine deacetylase
MKKKCKNHPEIGARRRCIECQKYICPECQIHQMHHIFCSWYCISVFFLKNNLDFIKIKREYLYLFVILIITQIFIHILLSGSDGVDEDIKQVRKSHQEPELVDTAFTVKVENVVLKGRAKPNTIIGIQRDSEFVATTITIKDSFKFKNLPLIHGENLISVWGFLPDGQSVFVDSIWIFYKSNYVQQLSQPIYRVKTRDKILALTFDGGSAANGADSIISILSDKNIKCTIFLTGGFIHKYPDLVTTLKSQGHELANHSYSHPHLTTWANDQQHTALVNVSRSFLQGELLRTDSVYKNLTGSSLTRFWRAPFGELNPEILGWAAEIGYRHIGWSPKCDTFDWVTDSTSSIYRTPDELYQHFLQLDGQNMLNGSIILMHLNSERKSNHAYKILPKLIDTLHRKNYKIVTVSSLLNAQTVF